MITVIINGRRATLKRYRWICADKETERMLNQFAEMDSPDTSDPDPERTIFEAISKLITFDKVVKFAPEALGGDWVVTKNGHRGRPGRRHSQRGSSAEITAREETAPVDGDEADSEG